MAFAGMSASPAEHVPLGHYTSRRSAIFSTDWEVYLITTWLSIQSKIETMGLIKEVISSPDFWKFAVPLVGAVVAWFVNEWRKRVADQYQRKEASYKELLRSLRGFYVGATSAPQLRSEFLNQLNTAWLYCPDEVIRKGYAFLGTAHSAQTHSDEQKEKAMGEFVAAIRQDILSRKLVNRSSLTAADFKHLNAQ
ncbi:hypothetical protein [Achromobacter insolitus]|uniref:hypothetical protein n=1 Tax=Achromobacter insolitus TaxID=217204 RepID=UPI00241C907B|nr:hypothetical protein [Achromobacter insolitus]